MSHVTRDTAKRLESAGFPQPLPEFGQVWYSNSGETCLVGHKDPNVRLFRLHEPERVYHVGGKICDIAVFAPTATDILKELGGEYVICFLNGMWHVKSVLQEKNASNKEAWAKSPGLTLWPESKHVNPAEAAALAYLAQKGKK